MADGLTKQLDEYFDKLGRLGDYAVNAVKEQIDIETDRAENEIRDNTPEGKTGGLARALRRTNISTNKKYGHRLEYEGENDYGESHAKIANIINYGSSTIKPRRFISKAIKKLKGLDDRAAQRFKKNSAKLSD